jgi:crossover junction endodeoxyribonuclease RuvC
LLNLSGTPTPDAADALACAICHAHTGASMATLARAAPELARGPMRIRRGRITGRP